MNNLDKIKEYFKQNDLENILKIKDYQGIRLREIKRGEIFIYFDDKLNNISFLVEGTAKVYPITGEGDIQILDFIYAMEILGDLELIVGKNAYNMVEAISPCTIIEIDIRVFKELLKGNDDLYMYLCKTIARKLTASTTRLLMMKSYPAKRRLYNYLVKLSDSEDKLEFDSIEMASVLGISDRYLRTLLDELCEEKIIESDNGRRIKGIKILDSNNEYFIEL